MRLHLLQGVAEHFGPPPIERDDACRDVAVPHAQLRSGDDPVHPRFARSEFGFRAGAPRHAGSKAQSDSHGCQIKKHEIKRRINRRMGDAQRHKSRDRHARGGERGSWKAVLEANPDERKKTQVKRVVFKQPAGAEHHPQAHREGDDLGGDLDPFPETPLEESRPNLSANQRSCESHERRHNREDSVFVADPIVHDRVKQPAGRNQPVSLQQPARRN